MEYLAYSTRDSFINSLIHRLILGVMKPNAGTNLSASSHSTSDNEQLLGSYRNCESLTKKK